MRRHVVGYHSTGSDNGTFSDFDTWQDSDIDSDPCVAMYDGWGDK